MVESCLAIPFSSPQLVRFGVKKGIQSKQIISLKNFLKKGNSPSRTY